MLEIEVAEEAGVEPTKPVIIYNQYKY